MSAASRLFKNALGRIHLGCWGVEGAREEGGGQGIARKAHKPGSLLCGCTDNSGPGADWSQGPPEPGLLGGKQTCSPGLQGFNLAEVCQLPQVTTLRIGHGPDRPPDARVNDHGLQRAGVVDFLMTRKSPAAHLVSCLSVLFFGVFFVFLGVKFQGLPRQSNRRRNRHQIPLDCIRIQVTPLTSKRFHLSYLTSSRPLTYNLAAI